MKLFWNKNKILVITMAAVLALGALFWGGLHLMKESQMQDVLIRTAEAEAADHFSKGQQDKNNDNPLMPTPSPVSSRNAEEIQRQIVEQEWRYQSIIPRINNTVPYNYKGWKEGEPVDGALSEKAIKEAIGGLYSSVSIDPQPR